MHLRQERIPFFNGERHQRQIECAISKIKLIVSHPSAETSVDTRPKTCGTASFRPLEWFLELTLGLVADGLSW